MKVLFLDIDGVVNNVGTTQRFEGYIGIRPSLAKHIKNIVEQTGCKIVLSSTWRLHGNSRLHVREQVGDFIDITPYFPTKLRGDEVLSWLSYHPEVTKYAILDDNSDFLGGQPLFRTSSAFGITRAIANDVIKYLNKE